MSLEETGEITASGRPVYRWKASAAAIKAADAYIQNRTSELLSPVISLKLIPTAHGGHELTAGSEESEVNNADVQVSTNRI